MTKDEALNLAAQLAFDLPKTKCADALLAMCLDRGYNLGICNLTGEWCVWDVTDDREIARCAW